MRKINFKTVLLFLLIVGIYFLPTFIVEVDKSFYENLNKINVPDYIFTISWTIIYVSLAVFIIINYLYITPVKSRRALSIYLITNYLMQLGYTISFFGFHNLFLGYIFAILTFLTMLFVLMEAFIINKKTTLLLIFPTLWMLFASILSVLIYLWN